jgi:hypothetical protein
MDKFERVTRCPEFYRRRYEIIDGEKRFKYCARFSCKLKGKRRFVPIRGRQIQKIIVDYISDAAPGIPSVELSIGGEILGRNSLQ